MLFIPGDRTKLKLAVTTALGTIEEGDIKTLLQAILGLIEDVELLENFWSLDSSHGIPCLGQECPHRQLADKNTDDHLLAFEDLRNSLSALSVAMKEFGSLMDSMQKTREST